MRFRRKIAKLCGRLSFSHVDSPVPGPDREQKTEKKDEENAGDWQKDRWSIDIENWAWESGETVENPLIPWTEPGSIGTRRVEIVVLGDFSRSVYRSVYNKCFPENDQPLNAPPQWTITVYININNCIRVTEFNV